MVRTHKKSRSVALTVNVLAEILLRVPAEHLVKMKRVSKSWNRVISDSHFVREHLRRERSRGVLLLNLSAPSHAEADKISYLPIGVGGVERADNYHISLQDFLPKVEDPDEHTVLGFRNIQSFDGLLLMEPDRPVDGKYQLRVCNPVTRSVKVLPALCGMQGCRWTIGYDPSVQRYKVVGLKVSTEKQRSLCYIFELCGDRQQGPRSWKLVDGPLPPGDHSVLAAAVCAKGKIHWLFSCDASEGNAKSGGFLVSMNLATEQFSSRELDPVPPRLPLCLLRDSYLGSEGVFYLFTDRCDSNQAGVLWTLKDFDNPVWVKRHVFNITNVFQLVKSDYWGPMTLFHVRTAFLDSGAVFEDDNKLIVKTGQGNWIYDMNTEGLRRIVADHGRPYYELRQNCKYYQVYHVNSLISWD